MGGAVGRGQEDRGTMQRVGGDGHVGPWQGQRCSGRPPFSSGDCRRSRTSVLSQYTLWGCYGRQVSTGPQHMPDQRMVSSASTPG